MTGGDYRGWARRVVVFLCCRRLLLVLRSGAAVEWAYAAQQDGKKPHVNKNHIVEVRTQTRDWRRYATVRSGYISV